MSADGLLEFFTSPFYRKLISLFITVSLILVACLVYFAISKRSNERLEVDHGAAPWNLLMGTFLDSFLITLLYTAESLIYSASNFAKDINTYADSPWLLLPFMSSIFALFAQLAIAWIAIRRVIVLRQWLGRKEDGSK
ncbi:MAG: hypothetical protein ACRCU5_01890 [Rhizobiaceae bacterium]